MHSHALLAAAAATLAVLVGATPVLPRADVDYYNPLDNGGSLLDRATPTLGEPLNVIISAKSSPEVLTDDGFLNFAQSINISYECLGLHLGGPQSANLGDGNGYVNQTSEYRYDFGNAEFGTCLESLAGGNHFRVFRQNGTEANSGALFLAVSKEKDVSQSHDIIPNGYDIGRDELIAAVAQPTSHNGVTYKTEVRNITGLLQPGADGVNHGIALDGVVALFTITVQ